MGCNSLCASRLCFCKLVSINFHFAESFVPLFLRSGGGGGRRVMPGVESGAPGGREHRGPGRRVSGGRNEARGRPRKPARIYRGRPGRVWGRLEKVSGQPGDGTGEAGGGVHGKLWKGSVGGWGRVQGGPGGGICLGVGWVWGEAKERSIQGGLGEGSGEGPGRLREGSRQGQERGKLRKRIWWIWMGSESPPALCLPPPGPPNWISTLPLHHRPCACTPPRRGQRFTREAEELMRETP